MNLDRAEEFLKSKGIDTEKYVIHDIKGGYSPQIPIALWLEEFAQQEVENNSILLDVNNSDDNECNCDYLTFGEHSKRCPKYNESCC